MAEVFYTPRAVASINFTSHVLSKYYALNNVRFYTSEHGKPYCRAPVFFSLSHTKGFSFLCVSRAECGIDAEKTDRRGDFVFIKRKLSPGERALADTAKAEFLKIWTRREATSKYLDMPVFSSFSRLTFQAEESGDTRTTRADSARPVLCGKPLPVTLRTFELVGHFVSVCLTNGETIDAVRFIENF